MGIESVLVLIDAEISKLQEARALLAGLGSVNGTSKMRGRKPGRKHRMSPEGRARIAAAVKARWERQKSGKKK